MYVPTTFPVNPSLHGYIKDIKADLLGNIRPVLTYNSLENGMTQLDFCYSLPESVRQDDCAIQIQAAFSPNFFWMPHLTPSPKNIAAQHIFRTPALIARGECKTLILIPDVENQTAAPLYLDMDAVEGTMTIGVSENQVTDHVLYERASGAQYPAGTAHIRFYLLAVDRELDNPFRPVLEFFWNRYGKSGCARLPKLENMDTYCLRTYEWAYRNWKEVVWQEFEQDGVLMGAPCFIATVFQRPDNPESCSERETRSIWNQAWFCSLRSASGLFRYARRHHDDALLEYARKTKELALAFPQQDGLFDSVVATRMKGQRGDPQNPWISAGWDTRYFGNSDRNPFVRSIEEAPRHILDMSFTAYYMLIWYHELEQDVRLLEYAKRYADRLVRLQFESGYYPAWIDSNGAPMGTLDDSPKSAMSAAFLFLLYRITGENIYYLSAKKAIDRVIEEIVPIGRWEDFETYWSCCTLYQDHVGKKIPRNQIYKQCNLSMYYTALACMEAYRCTQDKSYLSIGQRVLDEMLMTQSSYQPVQIPIPVCGGFGVLNMDGELNDARQSLFSELIMQYGDILQEKEYSERGLAAMRVAFSMMYCPENPEAKIQWEAAWPFLSERDYGFNMENYGHEGKTSANGIGIGEFTIFDWGNGAAAENYQRILDHTQTDLKERLP